MNTFGQNFRVTTFGESHGPAMGVVIDGCPAQVVWQPDILRRNLARRRPGQNLTVSARQENDDFEVLSGIYQGQTLGTPIAIVARNQDARSTDYKNLSPRAGHADDVWQGKFGHVDPRGGGRSSGRETLSRVMAGSVAEMLMRHLAPEMRIQGFCRQIGPYGVVDELKIQRILANPDALDQLPARCPDPDLAEAIETLLLRAQQEGESYGGVAEIWIQNPPPFLGQPVFHKLKADLASALLGIGASFYFGLGRADETQKGRDFHSDFHSENYAGIRGGLSTGGKIILQVGFKPTSSINDVAKKGRHDPCIIPRAIPVLEAMAQLVVADHLLWQRLDRV